jgi:hypothetical protein
MLWAEHVPHTGDRRGAYRVFVENPDGKRPIVRSKCKLEDHFKMDLK